MFLTLVFKKSAPHLRSRCYWVKQFYKSGIFLGYL